MAVLQVAVECGAKIGALCAGGCMLRDAAMLGVSAATLLSVRPVAVSCLASGAGVVGALLAAHASPIRVAVWTAHQAPTIAGASVAVDVAGALGVLHPSAYEGYTYANN